MKKIILNIFTFFFIVSANTLLAQEKEYELLSNPSLLSNVVAQQGAKISSTNKKLIIFTQDLISVSLPFVDDFSSNKFTSYDTSDYSASAKTDSVRYSFRINGLIPSVDTIRYITDSAYSYTYYPDSNKLDSTALLPAFNLSFYNNLNTPTVVTDNFDAWNPYYRPVYDTIADTVSYYILAKLDTMVILEIDSILFVNTHDFSSQTLWYENEVFVNSTYPINPPSIGVATFDGLDSTGYPYNFVNPGAYGLADKLTSKYLNLGVPLGVNESFLFSFYYQPKGLGNTPESTDSLVLEFKFNKYKLFVFVKVIATFLNAVSGIKGFPGDDHTWYQPCLYVCSSESYLLNLNSNTSESVDSGVFPSPFG